MRRYAFRAHRLQVSDRVAVLAAVMVAATSFGALAQEIPLEAAARAFDEAKTLSAADGGRLWSRPLAGPMFFVDRSSRSVVANQADPAGTLKPVANVFTGALPEEMAIANTAIDWLGIRWTMVVWPLPELRYARGRLLMHELFHRIQDDLGLPAANPANNHLDVSEGRIWLQLEWRALSEALIRAGDDRHRAVADALAFRLHRRSLFAGAADEERALELNEGLAEYTGYKTCGLPETVLPDRVAIRLDQQQGGTGFVRNFAYVSGPAYGLLLDAADPAWRKSLTKDSDLGDLLRAAMQIGELPQGNAELLRAAERYDGRALISAEKAREAQRQARLAEYRARFVDGPVLLLPASGDVSYSFDPNGIEAYSDVSSVYAPLRATDAWGVLEVTSGGAMLERRDGRVHSFRVPAPADPTARPVAGEGWTLRLSPGWSIADGSRPGDLTLRPAQAGANAQPESRPGSADTRPPE